MAPPALARTLLGAILGMLALALGLCITDAWRTRDAVVRDVAHHGVARAAAEFAARPIADDGAATTSLAADGSVSRRLVVRGPRPVTKAAAVPPRVPVARLRAAAAHRRFALATAPRAHRASTAPPPARAPPLA